jgi:RAB protein geranylgeranyltransferase component A
MQHPQQMNNTPNQEDHVLDVQNHVLIEKHQVSNFVDHVSKFKQQRSQEDLLPEEKDHVSKIETKDLDGKLKHDTTHVSEIDQEHVSKVK